jgi:hypothetical protein
MGHSRLLYSLLVLFLVTLVAGQFGLIPNPWAPESCDVEVQRDSQGRDRVLDINIDSPDASNYAMGRPIHHAIDVCVRPGR